MSLNLNDDNDNIFNNSNINDPLYFGDDIEQYAEGNDNTPYCFCQKRSYGDMVGCDNDDCKYQWFHFGCVGLTSTPLEQWFCSDECRDKKTNNLVKKKKKKKN